MTAKKKDKVEFDEKMKQLLDELPVEEVLDDEIKKLLNVSKKQRLIPFTKFLRGIIAKAGRMSLMNSRLVGLTNLAKSEKLRDLMSDERMTFKEALSKTDSYGRIIAKDNQFEALIESISETIEYLIKQNSRRNPKLGQDIKQSADAFAEEIGASLEKARKSGATSTRKIAAWFNEHGIKAAKGGQWSHVTVANIIKRRKALGLE